MLDYAHRRSYSAPRRGSCVIILQFVLGDFGHGRADAEIRRNASGNARQADTGRATARLWRNLRRVRSGKGGRAVVALLAMRRALLPGPLPVAQQYPGLAEAHRRKSARRGLRTLLADQQF